MAGEIKCSLKTNPGWDGTCLVLASAKSGQTALSAGFTNSAKLQKASGTNIYYPQAVYVGKTGYLYCQNKDGVALTFYGVAGSTVVLSGVTDIDGTNTTADELLFLYNA